MAALDGATGTAIWSASVSNPVLNTVLSDGGVLLETANVGLTQPNNSGQNTQSPLGDSAPQLLDAMVCITGCGDVGGIAGLLGGAFANVSASLSSDVGAGQYSQRGGGTAATKSGDPGLVLVGLQDCHKVNSQGTLYARYPIYSLRQSTNKGQEPQQDYTVFEFIPKKPSSCGVGGYYGINPCRYGDGTARFPYNEFDDELSTGVSGGPFDLTQYFDYGLPSQRPYGVKQIYRKLSDGSLQQKVGWNRLTATPGADPLIDGQVDPWLAPWDGTVGSCNSSFSTYFPQ